MQKRAQEAEAARKERMNRKYEKARAEEQARLEKEQQERLRTAKYKQSDPGKTWQDLQREQEARRKDRVEQRKMQLSAMATYPTTMAAHDENRAAQRKRAKEEGGTPVSTRSFVAQNPEEVNAADASL